MKAWWVTSDGAEYGQIAFADHPCEHGYQPIYPETLRRWAKRLRSLAGEGADG